MTRYVFRRTVYTVIVIIVASVAIFYGLRVAPGSPDYTIFNPVAPPEAREALRERLGLDRPLPLQYFTFVGHVFTGDLGHSLKSGKSIPELITTYGKNSLLLIAAATVVTYGVAIPLGVLAAVRRNSWLDQLAMGLANLGMGVPNFLLALILILILGTHFHLLPISGTGSFKQLILPAVVLSAEGVAVTLRMMRASMLEQLQQDYIRTLRAKGLGTGAIVWQHALRNALIPVISLSALQVGSLVGYTAIVEIVFRWPGIGQLLVNSVLQRDYPLAQMLSLLLTISVVMANFFANLAYAAVDPRIRYGLGSGA